MSVPSKEQLKARSKHLAKLLEEKYGVKASHGHCLEVIAQLFGFKDWNTAAASSEQGSALPKNPNPKTVGQLKAVLADYDDAAPVEVVRQQYVDPDFNSDGSATGPAGWMAIKASLIVEGKLSADDKTLTFGIFEEDERWMSPAESQAMEDTFANIRAQVDESLKPLKEEAEDEEPSEAELEEGFDRAVQMEIDIRRGK